MTDYGATATLDRKGRTILPASLVVEDRADPDNPNRTVRGAHRVDHLARILGPVRKDWSTQDRLRYWGAELYRDDRSIGVDGANPNMGDNDPTLRQGSPSSYGPPDARVDALSRYNAATAALPSKSVRAVEWVVALNLPIVLLENRSGRKRAAVRHVLMAGLDALVVHYEGCGR